MKRGRLTKEEQARRIKSLLIFIYTFRYATTEAIGDFYSGGNEFVFYALAHRLLF